MKVKVELPAISSRLRLGLTVIIALIVISSTATVMLFNPAQVLAYSRVIENSNGHSNPPMSEERSSPSVSSPSSSQSNESSPTPTAPSTISQDGGGDVTTQAPLQIPRTLQSNDLVNSLAFYEVTFITSTTGPIDKIEMVFPGGTNIGASGVIERVGIGAGTLTKAGSTLTYDVTTPVSVPAGTFIRLEMFGMKNPGTPSTTFTATLTTKDSGGVIIDGPSMTNLYTVRQVGTNDIADNAVTTPKIADGAVTGNKIAGTNKVIFGVCTGDVGALSPGGLGSQELICPDSNAEIGDEIVGFWSNARLDPAPVIINGVAISGSVVFGFVNTHSVNTAAQSPVEVSYIIFKK